MDKLLALPYELQIVLFAGYAGYKIATIGRGVTHRTEDFLLQVLAFGTIGRLVVAGIGLLISKAASPDWIGGQNSSTVLLLIGTTTLLVSIVSASIWRSRFQGWWSRLMEKSDVYRDDHEASVWASILAARSDWTCVQIHSEDGTVYESDFDHVPQNVPMNRITANDDGLAIYVTGIFRPDGSEAKYAINLEDRAGVMIEYFPRSTIKRLSVCWRSKS